MFETFKPTLVATPLTSPQDRKPQFLQALRSHLGQVKKALESTNIPLNTALVWRRDDPAFATEWDQIVQNEVTPVLEAEAVRRAMDGSDLLLMFMLKAHNRKRYDDKVAAENANPDKGLSIEIVDALTKKAKKVKANGTTDSDPDAP